MSFIHGPQTTIATSKGYLRGYKKDDVFHFLGVPYAYAERFMAPQEVEPWQGVKEATSYGYTAKLMGPDSLGDDLPCPHRYWPQSEHCQNLNVWTTTLTGKLPVVVWFHGGGFFAGSAIEQVSYDGTNMARYGNVVVVTVNHRLNVAGYLDLRKYGEKYIHSVNNGSLDLVMALKWVRDNIEAFGGDKDNVTIFGQSGGGGKVISLMNFPEAAGLFHKAMIMSGTLGEFLTDEGVDTTNVVDKCLELLGIDAEHIEDIETIDYQVLCDTYKKANAELGYRGLPLFTPQRGVDYLGDPLKVGFSESAKKVPVIIGSTFSEFNSLPKKYHRQMSEAEQVQALKEAFPKDYETLIKCFKKSFPNNPIIDILTYDDGAFRYSVKQWVAARLAQGCSDTFMYLFKPEMKMNVSCMPNHCADIAYFFHNVDKVDSADIGEKTESLQDEMFTRFMHFAKTGDVNNEKYEGWKASDKNDEYTYLFDHECSLAENLDTEFLTELRKAKKPFSIHDVSVD